MTGKMRMDGDGGGAVFGSFAAAAVAAAASMMNDIDGGCHHKNVQSFCLSHHDLLTFRDHNSFVKDIAAVVVADNFV